MHKDEGMSGKYSSVKRLLIMFPWVRKVGAVLYMNLPNFISEGIYKFSRKFIFKDNLNRM